MKLPRFASNDEYAVISKSLLNFMFQAGSFDGTEGLYFTIELQWCGLSR